MKYLAPILFAVTALSQTPEKPGSIEGTVVNSVTKAPLRKVDLALTNGEMSEDMAAMMQQFKPNGVAPDLPSVATKTFAASTDGNGKFRFDNIPAGTWYLTAKKAGFGDERYKGGVGGELRLTPGQEMTKVDFRLVPNATLTGRVVDEDGEPYPSAMVTALTFSYSNGHRTLTPADFTQSNNKGEFSLSKVPPGHYFLCADIMHMDMGFGTKPPPPPADGSPEMAYVSTYLPGTTDVAAAQKIDVAAGAELSGFNIQLRKSKVVRVTGKLTDETGAPIKTAQIMLMAGGGRVGSMSMAMVSDPEGKFELTGLQPGTYTATAVQMQGSSPKMSMQTLVVPDKSIKDVVLGSHGDATIQGQIVVDGDAKVALEKLTIHLAPGQGVTVMPSSAKVDKSGAFTVDHLTPAPYDLPFSFAPRGTYLKSVLFNNRESLGQTLDCTATTRATLQLVFGSDGGTVNARVSNEEKPAANATVVLLPSDPARRVPPNVRQESTDESGKVTLHDLPPGDYLAFAWEEVEDEIWFDPDFMRKSEGQAVKVHIGPKSQEEVQLKLIPASK